MLTEATKNELRRIVLPIAESFTLEGVQGAYDPTLFVDGFQTIVDRLGITEMTGEVASDTPLDCANNRAEAEQFIAGLLGLM